MPNAQTKRLLATLVIASALGGCATTSTYVLRSPIRSSPKLLWLTMGGGLVATSIVSWKLLDTGETFRPTIFVPLVVVVDLLGAMSAALSTH
jgi:hypothetical protein